MACRISHPFHWDLSASQQRNFEGPDPYVPVWTQKMRHIIVRYSHIWIYPYTFIGFSNPEGALSFLLSNLAAFSTRTRHRKIAAPLTLGVVNISCDKKGRSQSFLQVKVPPDAFRVPVQALVLKKKLLCFTQWKVPYLPRWQVTFCSFHFLLARMYRWVWFFLGGGRGMDGEEREREKKDRWHWSTEEINRVTSLHSWGLLEGFLLLKTVSSERWQTHRSMKSELQLCSVNLVGCFPSPRLFRMRRLMGKHDFDVLLNSSVEHVRHEAYQLQVQSIWAKFTVGIDDFLHCFRCHFEQVI